VLLAGFAAFIYSPLLKGWLDQVLTDSSFSYGIAIPFVSAYLAYLKLTGKRGATIRATAKPDWIGLVVIGFGCALLIVGERAALNYVARLSFLVVLGGIVLTLYGRAVARELSFPYGFLLLALPIPALIYLPFTFDLQLLSSALAGHVLDLLAVPALREGNVIVLPNISLEVAEACSGVHSIFALLAVAILTGYLFLRSNWRRFLLALSAPPLAIALNASRLSLMALVSYFITPEWAEGVAHFSAGLVLFAIGAAVILALSYRLADRERRASAPPAAAAPRAVASSSMSFAVHGVAAAALLAVAMMGSDPSRWREIPEPLQKPWSAFPIQVGGWHGRDLALTPREIDALGTDSFLLREYERDGDPAPPVDLYVAYFPTQHEGTAMHSPLHCIPGAGWETERQQILPVYLDAYGTTVGINKVVFRREDQRMLVLYWYVEQGVVERSEWSGALRKLWDGVRYARSDGCLIRFDSRIEGSDDAALARELALLHLTVPLLVRDFLPTPPTQAQATTLAGLAGL
jgi:exosortase D (VPLPA-CTERM-specific)